MISKIRIASRKSALARLQSYHVAHALKKVNPNLEIDFIFQESMGDKNLDSPLWQLPEKGVFTKDLQLDLLAERCDVVVHSWKDLPTETPAGTEIVATLERADIRDVLLIKKDLASGENLKRILLLSSSPRRAYNLSHFLVRALPFVFEKIDFESVRGNVPTRVRKLINHSEAHGLILAKAALDRLLSPSPIHDDEIEAFQFQLRQDLLKLRWMILPLSQNPTAPAQGALALEIKSEREDLKALLAQIHFPDVFENVQKERHILREYGGGCHQKIGATVLNKRNQKILFLKGETLAQDKSKARKLSYSGSFDNYSKTTSSNEEKASSKKSSKKVWPQPKESVPVFERSPAQWPTSFERPSSCIWSVSRAHALPTDFKPRDSDVLWVAGSQTWKALAQKGLWVNGSHDSLGEENLQETLKFLAPHQKVIKLSHDRAPAPILATYQLRAHPQKLDFCVPEGIEACYWMSASLFDEMLLREPSLLQRVREHACGFGKTYDLIRERIEAAGAVLKIYTGPEEWWKEHKIRVEED
jgi:hydroxymethylbilane synthase